MLLKDKGCFFREYQPGAPATGFPSLALGWYSRMQKSTNLPASRKSLKSQWFPEYNFREGSRPNESRLNPFGRVIEEFAGLLFIERSGRRIFAFCLAPWLPPVSGPRFPCPIFPATNILVMSLSHHTRITKRGIQ